MAKPKEECTCLNGCPNCGGTEFRNQLICDDIETFCVKCGLVM